MRKNLIKLYNKLKKFHNNSLNISILGNLKGEKSFYKNLAEFLVSKRIKTTNFLTKISALLKK